MFSTATDYLLPIYSHKELQIAISNDILSEEKGYNAVEDIFYKIYNTAVEYIYIFPIHSFLRAVCKEK